MKRYTSQLFITASLTAAMVTPGYALEAPADDAPPPPAVGQALASKPLSFGNSPLQEPMTKEREVAFLGVVTAEVPDILAEHLKLTDGKGILVRSLMPDGPAAKAGISANDIILSLADQAISTPENLSDAVSEKNPSDVVTVELIHKGDFKTISVTLAKRPDHFASARSQAPSNLNLDHLPKELADRLRGALAGDPRLSADPGAMGDASESMQDTMQNLQQQLQGLMGQAPGAGKIQMQSDATLRFKDQNGCIEIKSNGATKDVTFHDCGGKILWTGPWNTEQDKAAAPEEYRNRIEALNLTDGPDANAGFQLQIPQASGQSLENP